jgi:hypothetical protein
MRVVSSDDRPLTETFSEYLLKNKSVCVTVSVLYYYKDINQFESPIIYL